MKSTPVEVRDVILEEIELVRLFLIENGWEHRVGDSEVFGLLIEKSQRTAVATWNGVIVGFARAITDGLSNGYISMVVVATSHRRQGIGRQLVLHMMGSNQDITWILRAGREGAERFFAALGFMRSEAAMERIRSS